MQHFSFGSSPPPPYTPTFKILAEQCSRKKQWLAFADLPSRGQMQGWIIGDLRLGTHLRLFRNASVQGKMNDLTRENIDPRGDLHMARGHLVTHCARKETRDTGSSLVVWCFSLCAFRSRSQRTSLWSPAKFPGVPVRSRSSFVHAPSNF